MDASSFELDESFSKMYIAFSFQYFDSYEKGKQVLNNMLRHSRPGAMILLTDVPDKSKWAVYYDSFIKKLFYFKQKLTGKQSMGKFWSEKELKAICKAIIRFAIQLLPLRLSNHQTQKSSMIRLYLSIVFILVFYNGRSQAAYKISSTDIMGLKSVEHDLYILKETKNKLLIKLNDGFLGFNSKQYDIFLIDKNSLESKLIT